MLSLEFLYLSNRIYVKFSSPYKKQCSGYSSTSIEIVMAANEAPVLRSDPLADDIYSLMAEAGRKFQIIYQCLKLGIFDEIDGLEKNETADNIASKLNYNPQITERLLNSLVCFNLLNKECGVYSLTESSKKYMVSTKPTSMVPRLRGEFEFMFPLFNSLPSVVKKGSNSDRYQHFIKNDIVDGEGSTSDTCGVETDGNNPRGDNATGKPTPADFITMMNSKLIPIAPAVTQSYDFSRYRTLVDLGGGSGYLAYEFIKVYENMKAIVFDLPDCIELVAQQPNNNKVEFISGDFFKDENLPMCDLMILSHILHNWGEGEIDIILKKVFDSINPGGCILILEKCLNEDKTGPHDAILLDTLMMVMCEGRERTFLEYQNLLQQYGFTNILWREIQGGNSQDVILAFKPENEEI